MAYFAEALLDYHQQCTEILKGLVETMQEKYVTVVVFLVHQLPSLRLFPLNRREEAAQRPKSEFVPKTLSDLVMENETGKC